MTHRDDDRQLSRDVAIPRLVEEHGGRLYGLARRLCGSADEAEDLVQEVFLAAWRAWDDLDNRDNPRPWLWTIAAHACQRMHRKRVGEPSHLVPLDEDPPFARKELGVVEDGLDAAARDEARARVGDAIANLPSGYRMPIVLRDIVGFSTAEVAAILGVAEGTVKSRVHRARMLLRGALEGALPKREVPPAAYSEQVCLDLLKAKQESLDRGVPMPGVDRIICERCSVVFAQMDLTQEVCRQLGEQQLPAELREVLEERFASDAS